MAAWDNVGFVRPPSCWGRFPPCDADGEAGCDREAVCRIKVLVVHLLLSEGCGGQGEGVGTRTPVAQVWVSGG